MKTVIVILGSKSDLHDMQGSFDTLDCFGVSYDVRIISAHRTPDAAADLAGKAAENGVKVLICAAGMAAHLAGAIAAHTVLPVIGVPLAAPPFNGFDSLLSTVQMPPGIPVAAVTAGPAGGKNAALLAIEILALSDPALARKLLDFRKAQTEKILTDDSDQRRERGN